MTISCQLRRTRDQHYIFVVLYGGAVRELISTGQKIAPADWNKKLRKPSDPNSEAAMIIDKIREDIGRARRLMIAQDIPVTPYSLKEQYLKAQKQSREQQQEKETQTKASKSSVTSLIEKWKSEALDEYQDSTRAVVMTSINMFKTFISDRYPRLERNELSPEVFREYSRHLEDKRKLADSIHGKRIKHLRWFLKWAGIDESIIKKIKIRTVLQDERNIFRLTMAELTSLENVDVSGSTEQQKAKDMFLIGCYTGLRISDIKRISPHRIRNGSIEITQKKNRKLNSVPLLPQLDAILKRYNYHAPKISEQQVNESIKLVCDKAGINTPTFKKIKKAGKLIESIHHKHELITTHSAGKTFISLAGDRWGLRPEEIAAIVGKDVKTILSYYLDPDAEAAKQKIIEAENRAQMKIFPLGGPGLDLDFSIRVFCF